MDGRTSPLTTSLAWACCLEVHLGKVFGSMHLAPVKHLLQASTAAPMCVSPPPDSVRERPLFIADEPPTHLDVDWNIPTASQAAFTEAFSSASALDKATLTWV